MKHSVPILLLATFLLTSVLLVGCVARLATLGPVESAAISRGLLGRGVVASSALSSLSLRTVRVIRVPMSNPRLYVTEGGQRRVLGEVLSARRIRFSNGQVHEVPGQLVVVRGDNARIRTGPGTHYRMVTRVMRDELFISLEEVNGWHRIINADGTIAGFVAGSLLVSATALSSMSSTAVQHRPSEGKISVKGTILQSAHPLDRRSPGTVRNGERVAVTDYISLPAARITKPTTLTASDESRYFLPLGASVYWLGPKTEDTLLVALFHEGRQIIGEIPKLSVTRTSDETWFLVKTRDGREGWILSNFVEMGKE